MDKEITQEFEFDIKGLVLTILSKIWISILAAIICGAGGVFYSVFGITPLYTSTAAVWVFNSQYVTYSETEFQGDESFTKECMVLIKSTAVLEPVIEGNGLDLTYDELRDKVSVSMPAETRFINISVTDADPAEAKKLADLICLETVERITDFAKSERLRIVEYGNLPYAPSSPNVAKNGVFAAFIGFIIPMFIVAAVYLFDDTLVSADDVEKRLGVNVIGRVPHSGKLSGKSSRRRYANIHKNV